MIYLVLCVTFLTIIKGQDLDFTKISLVTKAMRMRNCLVICHLHANTVKKLLTQEDETHWALSRIEDIKENNLRVNGLFLCADYITEEGLNIFLNNTRSARYHDWVIYGSGHENFKEKLYIKVDERMYFLDKTNLTLSETYTINNHTVDNIIGHVEVNEEKYVFKSLTGDSFFDRRSNFHGLVLKVVTDCQLPYVDFNVQLGNASSLPINFLMNITYVTQTGMFVDLFTLMKRDLNFSSNEFVRADRKWGDFSTFGKWDGMIGSLVDREADIAVASITLQLERVDAVDFLPPIVTDRLALLIKKNFAEQASWKVFLHPFSSQLWICVFTAPLLTLLIIKVIQKYYAMEIHEDDTLIFTCNLVAEYWMIFSMYLGRDPAGIIFKEKLPLRLILFSTFLLGSVLFMSYNGALTSMLAVSEKKLPFTSLKGLLESSYSLVTPSRGYEADLFKNARGDIFQKLYQDKMEKNPEKSFAYTFKSALSTLNQSQEMALFGEFGSVAYFSEYDCQFEIVWRSVYSSELSMALPKGSPFFQFLQLDVLRHMEKGNLARLGKVWNTGWPTCADLDNHSLGFEKLISLFTLLIAGFGVSFGIFVLERILTAPHCSFIM